MTAALLLFASACATSPVASSPSSAGGSSLAAPSSASARREAPASGERLVLAELMPAVVLVVGMLEDGSYSFGSGLVLDDEGTLLTNMHVVAQATSLGAMFYEESRDTYNFQEGGLGRFLFEYEKDILAARLVRGDPGLDLALLKVEADTRHIEKLPIRKEPPEPGERVVALGHPGGAPWSFTAGIISALQTGLIQHDATLDFGNSGGPLIDEQGRVVGINTSTLFKSRVAYARPISLARAMLDSALEPFVPDLGNPERAFKTCVRAVELSSPAFVECFDIHGLVEGAAAFLSRKHEMEVQSAKVRIEMELRQRLLSTLKQPAPSVPVPSSQGDERRGADGEDDPTMTAFRDRMDRAGLKQDLRAASSRIQVLRMGTRVVDRRDIEPELVALRIEGRNADRTPFNFTTLMKLSRGKWRLILDDGLLSESQRLQIYDWPPVMGSEMLLGPIGTMSLDVVFEPSLPPTPNATPGAPRSPPAPHGVKPQSPHIGPG